jgi:hypothetical protein
VSHTSSFSLVKLIKKDLNLEKEVKELEDVFEQDEFNDQPKNLMKIIISSLEDNLCLRYLRYMCA